MTESITKAGSIPLASPAVTIWTRMADVLVSPGQVFDEVLAAPFNFINMIIPVLVSCMTGLICFLSIFHEPAFQQILESNRTVSGQLTTNSSNPVQVASDAAAAGPANLGAEIAYVLASALGTLWSAVVVWLLGRFVLGTAFPFLKTLEVTALAQTVLILSTVVTTLLTFATGDPYARPALSMFVVEFDPTNSAHRAMAAFNVFHFWTAGVLSIGLAKLGKVSFYTAAFWVYSYFILGRVALIFLGEEG